MTISQLRENWMELESTREKSIYREYDALHPLSVFYGINAEGKHEFFIVLEEKPNFREYFSDSISLRNGKRKDGSVSVVFKLENHDYEDVFLNLCWDLAEFSRRAATEKESTNLMLNRFQLWQKLFEKSLNEHLGVNQLKGLFGELYFLLNFLVGKYGIETAVESWLGPNSNDQDFSLPDYWYEVKTTTPGAITIPVTSIEQLDSRLEGRLVWIQSEKVSAVSPDALTVPDIIREIEQLITSNEYMLDKFRSALIQAGYVENEYYSSIFFRTLSLTFFRVTDEFPVLRRDNLPDAVVSAEYRIEIGLIKQFSISGGTR